MANIKTRAIDRDEFELIIATIQQGFTTNAGQRVRPNTRISAALILQANLGLRIGDIVRLRLSDFIYESGRYRLQIREQKTGKERTTTVPNEIYIFLQKYALEHNLINPKSRLFSLTVRAIQSHLKLAADYLGLENISTHSFRKYFANSIYLQDYNVELVRVLLNHSNVAVTQHYLSIDTKQVEQALLKHIVLPA